MTDDSHEDIGYADTGRRSRDYGNDLEDIGKSTTEIINIDTMYQPSWGPAEGFRENYQNWKDGIMRSFKLSEANFKVESVESHGERFFPVYHPKTGNKQLLGYMRFIYDSEKLGSLEMTNFEASLQRRHLGIGGSTKASDAQQLGQHGEGLKLSALFNRRHPHSYGFTVYCTGCKWTFGWNVDRKLNCRIQRVPRHELAELKEEAAEQDEKGITRVAKARVWQDVSIVVGDARRCRSLKGEIAMTAKIPLVEFEQWLKMTIDISPSEKIVKTKAGDLILDPAYSNKLYLHGLLLPGGSKSGRKFTYGYNLRDVTTGRDRDAISDAAAESERITAIWEYVLSEEAETEDSRPYLALYIDMIRQTPNKAADVYDLEENIAEHVATMLWESMIKEKTNGRRNFYYREGSSSHDVGIIEKSLNLHPTPLRYELWSIFTTHCECNTPREEQLRLFTKTKPTTLPKNDFAASIITGLRAILALDPITASLKITPVRGDGLGIDVNYQEGEFKIADSCFEHTETHKTIYCEDSDNKPQDPGYVFTCDHAIHSLYNLMLNDLKDAYWGRLGSSKARHLSSMAHAKIRQMPRAIKIETNIARSILYISWTSVEPCNKAHEKVRVTLHSEKCTGIKDWENQLLLSFPMTPVCSCPHQVSTIDTEYVEFKGLNSKLRYRVMISRNNNNSIYGITPPAVSVSDSSLVVKRFSITKTKDTTMSPASVSALFAPSKAPEGWGTFSHNDLFKDGFPYTHTWMTSQAHDLQIFVARAKPGNVKAKLKRALGDDTSEQAAKKQK